MATFIFDGTKDLTVTKSDIVVVTGGAAGFAGASFGVFGAGGVVSFGAFKVTVSDAATVAELGGVLSYPDGSVNIGKTAAVSGGDNSLASSLPDYSAVPPAVQHAFAGDKASQVSVIFGGSGLNDAADGDDSIAFNGKGTFTVYGNGGIDSITGASLDSSTVATVYGGGGADTITLTGAKSAITVYGGSDKGADVITVVNNGTTTIYGGSSANDSADSADTITFGSVGATGGGTFTVYGNGGDDNITLGAGKLDSTATATVYGGAGLDTITLNNGTEKGTITVYGGSDAAKDVINVTNKGTTTIYGGSGVNDSVDSADTIDFAGAGTFTVYGNGGDDVITGGSLDAKTAATVYGGAGADQVTLTGADSANLTVYGNAGEDTLTVTGAGKSTVTVYGGSGFSDATDVKDAITLNGTGTFTAYGNGGDDTITVNVNSAAGNTASVFGGAGKDTINLAATVNTGATFTLSGGPDADTFNIVKGTGTQVTITDYTSADKMVITTGTAGSVTAVVSSATTLQGALDAAAATAGANTVVAFQGNSYVVVNDGTAGFNAANDMAIKLTGVTDALSVATTITTVA